MNPELHEEKKIEQRIDSLISESRVADFSDGVFAFAATLLVIKIDLPHVLVDQVSTNFSGIFATLWPQYLANIVSFLVIGYYWLNHHAIFSMVKRYNMMLVWINIVFLITLSFLPFPVDLYGDFPTLPAVVMFYTASLAVVGYMLAGIWIYASYKHRSISLEMSQKQINYYTARNLIAPVIFTLSIPLVWIHPVATPLSWLTVLLGIFVLNKVFHQKKLSKVEKASI